MCGIFCSVSRRQNIPPEQLIEERLRRRGPDSITTIPAICPGHRSDENGLDCVYINLISTVLSLRGSQTVTQPYQDGTGHLTLCWNGEAWTIAGQSTWDNDTESIHSLLAESLSDIGIEDRRECPLKCASRIAEELSRVAGPYAFVLFDQPCAKLYFGRDFLGRRSLMWKVTSSGDLIISSISDGDSSAHWKEVETDGIYCVDLGRLRESTHNIAVEPQVQRWGQYAVSRAPYRLFNVTSPPSVRGLDRCPDFSKLMNR